jgi:hypothetical protein
MNFRITKTFLSIVLHGTTAGIFLQITEISSEKYFTIVLDYFSLFILEENESLKCV